MVDDYVHTRQWDHQLVQNLLVSPGIAAVVVKLATGMISHSSEPQSLAEHTGLHQHWCVVDHMTGM